MKYLITIEYFGKNYAGWQFQKNALSVQEVLENRLSLVLREKIKLFASGRTDSGVHALGQKAHFETNSAFPFKKIPMAVNSTLPEDIRVLDISEVDEAFHAQYSAKRKTYVYKSYLSFTISPTRHQTHAQMVPPVDFEKMREAAKLLEGTHDFKAFSSTGSGVQTTIRTLSSVLLTQDGDEITLSVTGNGFLYNMVRIIAGTLYFIGKGRIPIENIALAFETGNRKLLGKTFPPYGLYLQAVEYEDF